MRRHLFLIALLIQGYCFAQTITYSGSTTLCPSGTLLLTVAQPNPIPTYQWQLNGSNVGTNTNTYTAISAGNYRVILTRGGNSDTSNTVVISDTTNPVPSFTFPATINCSNIPVGFTNTSGTGLTFEWDFDDLNSGSNNTATLPNPTHTFIGTPGNANQIFNVKLTARNSFGCIGTITRTVTTKQLPSTGLDGPNLRSYNGSVYFRNCSSDAAAIFEFTNASTTVNTGYKIIWGDGAPDSIFSSFTGIISHSYNIGTYPLSFIVTGNGCIDTTTYYVYVGSNPAVGLGNPGNTTICTGVSLTFPITGTSTNTPGTTYTVTFNDGSAPVNFNHPAPADVTHNFTNGSCGITTQTTPVYTNSFSATIEASNPCLTSAATVVPIYVSVKPSATFTVSPKDTTCVGITTTITNTSITNNYINAPNCTPGKFVWNISPSTGWSLSSGSLGSDNGSPNAGSWSTLSTNTLGIVFSQPGLYTIKLRVGNPVCGKDSIIKTICVNPTPIANFNLDQNIGCAPFILNATNIPSANNCGNNSYNWDVTYAPTAGCLPNTSSYSFIGGTNSTSTNPKFQFDNPGVYTVSLIAISPGGSCSSVVVSKTITVKGKPQASITAASSICKGESITPTATTDCYITAATTYAWTFNGGNPATSNSNPPGSITYNTSGNYNIAVDVTNECGVTTATKAIAVNDVTIAAAGSSQNICGSVVTMAANTAAVGTGEWTNVSGPNIPFITNSSLPTTTITGLIPGTYVFRWTISNGNCTSQSDVTIIISAGASIANAGTDQDLCLSNSTTLNANTPAIGTGTWSQVSGAAATIAAPANASTSISGLVPGTYVFRWTITFSNCTPNTDDVQVIIYNNPSAANAGTNQIICASSVTLTGNTPAIGNGTWSQIGNTPAPANIINTTTASTSVSGLVNPGVYKFVWTISNGPCVSTKDTVEINVTEVSTTANAGTDINSCIGSTVILAGNTATVGSGVWTIVSGPAGAIITNSSQPNTSVTGMGVGTYVLRWTITNGNCPASSDDVQVIIYDNPSAANAGTDQTICASSVTITGNTPAIGSGAWSQLAGGPNTATITTASSTTTSVTGLIPGIYKFKWTISNGPCLTKQDTVEINVTEVATTANAGIDIRQCAISSITLAGNTATVGIGVWSFVSGPAGSLIANTSLPTTGVTGLVPGTYIFRWTITNGNCPSSTDDVQVIVDENVTVADAGPAQNKCGVSVTMAANTPVVGSGQWSIVSGPTGALITNNALPATTITGLVPGNYVFKWTITNGSCSSSSDVAVTIFAGASAAVAGTDQDLCLATTANLNAVAPTVGTGEWSQTIGPNTAVIVNSSGNSTAANGLIPGVYIFKWTVTYSNCTPNIDEVQVTIYNNPTVAAAGSDQIICAASTSFAANVPLVGSGAWSQITGPSTATITDINSASSLVSDLVPGLYRFKWTISSGPCIASEDIIEINVSAIATTANAGLDSVYCNLSSINLTANVAAVGTGVWSFVSGPNTASISTPGLNITSVTGLIPGTYNFRWTITSGVCPPSIDDVEIKILNSLQNTISTPVDTICAGQQAVINGALPSGGTGIYLYQWQQSADGINWTDITGETNQSLSIILNATTFFQRKVTSLPCESFSNVIKIFVQPGITNNLISPNDSICINTAAPFLTGSTPNGGDGIYSYQWQQSIDGGISWNDIAGEISTNYNPGILIQTTKYRRFM
jgi:large repetitive protein